MNSIVPHNLNELANTLASLSITTKILAGGTDLIIQINCAEIGPATLLFIGEIPELRMIDVTADSVFVGSAATMTEISESTAFPPCMAALQEAAGSVGSLQVRNRATIGGNVANASPAGDLYGVLCLLNAAVMLFNKDGSLSEMKAVEFVKGPGQINLLSDQIIYGFRIPVRDHITHFKKLGSRSKVTIARIDFEMGMKINESGIIEDAEIWTSSAFPKPVCFPETAHKIQGRHINESILPMIISNDISGAILSQNRSSGAYKSYAIKGLVEDVLWMFKENN